MRIRPAEAADVPALAALAAASYRAAFLPIIGEAGLALRWPAFFARRFEREWPSLRAAEGEGAGSPLVGFHQVRGGRIDMLFLAPDAMGRGWGRALLGDAEAAGATELECFRDNHRARGFYERWGWRPAWSLERDFAGGLHAFVIYRKG